MILQQPAAISRVFGLSLSLISTWLSARETIEILGRARYVALWQAIGSCLLLGVLAFTLTCIGEWLWSFEEGWDRLRLSLRYTQAALIIGGLVFVIIIRIEDALHLL